jgi:sugar phosphate isomerase/epimerase
MKRVIDRRDFLKSTGAAGAGISLAMWRGPSAAAAEKAKSSTPHADKLGWPLGCAQYTFRRFCLYETIEKLAELGILYVEPAFFLAVDKARPALKINESLSAAVRKEVKAKLAEYGVQMASFYTDLKKDKEDALRKFEFAKDMGVKTLVAEPPPEALDMLEGLCDRYEINLSIHNHPKPNSRYWNPDAIVEVCKGRGKRIGACCDTGHWVRSGLDVVECLKKLQGRIAGFHLKDVIESGKPAARDVPLGQGKANYAAALAELHRQGYKGLLVIEYEHDTDKLMDDVAACAAFVDKTAKSLAG